MGRTGDRRPEGRARDTGRVQCAERDHGVGARADDAHSGGAGDPAQRLGCDREAEHELRDHGLRASPALRASFGGRAAELRRVFGDDRARAAEPPGIRGLERAEPERLLAVSVRRGGRGHRGTGLHRPARDDLRRAESSQPEDQGVRRQPRSSRLRRRRVTAADPLADDVHPRHGHCLPGERPDEADHGHLQPPSVPDPLVDPAGAAAHGNLARHRRLREDWSPCSARPSTGPRSPARTCRSPTRSTGFNR